jgi:hypothetical protein
VFQLLRSAQIAIPDEGAAVSAARENAREACQAVTHNLLKTVRYNKQMAETEGFEPSIRLTAYDDLANRCLQPLGHVSALLPFG